jgi:hypothetical protein
MLDADDVWMPEKLSQQIAILSQLPDAVALYGTTRYWFGWTGLRADTRMDYVQPHHTRRWWGGRRWRSPGVVGPPDLLTGFLRGDYAVPSISSVMFRRAATLAVGGFEEDFVLYEDQTLLAKLCLEAPVFLAGECWDWYRQHAGSLSAREGGAAGARAARIRYLDWLAGYAARRTRGDAAFATALRLARGAARHLSVRRAAASLWRRALGGPL